MKMALVHEWLSGSYGSEKTFLQMAEAYPEADLYALTHDRDACPVPRPVRTTWLQRTGPLRERRAVTLPLMPIAWRSLEVDAYDTVVTSSHAFSRYFPVGSARHLSYVYTPMRYAWSPEIDGRGGGALLGPARAALRRLDARSLSTTESLAVISNAVADRVRCCYGRESTVIFPPVEVDDIAVGGAGSRSRFLLGMSRWIPYKRLDLVIDVGEALGRPVVIVGSGPSKRELQERAEKATIGVTLVERPSDAEVRDLMARCAALVFPPEEDFGIVPVEAQAAGAPVVAYGCGGSLDTVVDGVTGALAADQTVEAFAEATARCLRLGDVAADCRANAERFSNAAFVRRFRRWVDGNEEVVR